jgi:hypothetical protein
MAQVEREIRWLSGWRLLVASLSLIALCALASWARMGCLQRSLKYSVPSIAMLGPSHMRPGEVVQFEVDARNIATQTPCVGMRLHATLLYENELRPVDLGTETTDKEGRARVRVALPSPAPFGEHFVALEGSCDGSSVESAAVVSVARPETTTVLATDKPIYQPGQTISFRSISVAGPERSPVASAQLTYEMRDANGSRVMRKTAVTSEFGFASGQFEIADQAPLGMYTLSAGLSEQRVQRSIEVKRYALPKFRLDLTTESSFAPPGAKVSGEVRANYTFGEPVTGAKVKIYYAATTGTSAASGASRVEAVGDARGRFPFRLELPNAPGTGELVAEVQAPSGDTQKRSVAFTITRDPVELAAIPESPVLVAGLDNPVLVRVRAPGGGAPLKARIRIEPSGVERETDEQGYVTLLVKPSDKGELTLTARGQGGYSTTKTFPMPFVKDPMGMLVQADRTLYRAGDTATVRAFAAESQQGDVLFQAIASVGGRVVTARSPLQGGVAQASLRLPTGIRGRVDFTAARADNVGSGRVWRRSVAVAGKRPRV